jgi:putative ATP-binding cassette transporter
MHSQDAELARLQNSFDQVKLITWKSMILNKRLNWFNHFYGPFSSIIFMVILMPFFIRGEVDLGRIKQCEMALGQVSGALNYFVGNYGRLASYRAVVDRLYNFRTSALKYLQEKLVNQDGAGQFEEKLVEVLARRGIPEQWPCAFGGLGKGVELQDSPKLALASREIFVPPTGSDNREKAHVLELQSATLSLPSGDVLLRDVDFRVPAGQCVLVCGKEGAGKSTLLRALAGMWPYMNAAGQHGAEETVLINQKPRLPTPMTLREAVAFPKESGVYSDAEIFVALHQVKLGNLALSGLDVKMDVNSTLSGGEFQRLMVAHCLLAKPRWVLLDESMAHLSRDNQVAMYSLLRSELVAKHGCGIVSTSHDWRMLSHFHDVHYIIEADSTKGCSTSARPVSSLSVFDPASQAPESTDSQPNETVEDLRSGLADRDAEIKKLRKELEKARKKAASSRCPDEDPEDSDTSSMSCSDHGKEFQF